MKRIHAITFQPRLNDPKTETVKIDLDHVVAVHKTIANGSSVSRGFLYKSQVQIFTDIPGLTFTLTIFDGEVMSANQYFELERTNPSYVSAAEAKIDEIIASLMLEWSWQQ